MLFQTVFVVLLALGLPSSYHSKDLRDARKISQPTAASDLTPEQRVNLEKVLKASDIDIDINTLTPQERLHLFGFSISGVLPSINISGKLPVLNVGGAKIGLPGQLSISAGINPLGGFSLSGGSGSGTNTTSNTSSGGISIGGGTGISGGINTGGGTGISGGINTGGGTGISGGINTGGGTGIGGGISIGGGTGTGGGTATGGGISIGGGTGLGGGTGISGGTGLGGLINIGTGNGTGGAGVSLNISGGGIPLPTIPTALPSFGIVNGSGGFGGGLFSGIATPSLNLSGGGLGVSVNVPSGIIYYPNGSIVLNGQVIGQFPVPTLPVVNGSINVNPTIILPSVTVPTVNLPSLNGSININGSVSLPAVSLPTVTVPTVTVPIVTVPIVPIPSVNGSISVNVPTINVPTVTVPVPSVNGSVSVNGSGGGQNVPITLPSGIIYYPNGSIVLNGQVIGQIPVVTVPSVSGSVNVNATFSIPTVNVPTVTVPTVTIPTVIVPTVTIPTVNVPTVTLPTVTVPTVTVPTIPVPSGNGTITINGSGGNQNVSVTGPTGIIYYPNGTIVLNGQVIGQIPTVTGGSISVNVPTVTVPVVTVPTIPVPSGNGTISINGSGGNQNVSVTGPTGIIYYPNGTIVLNGQVIGQIPTVTGGPISINVPTVTIPVVNKTVAPISTQTAPEYYVDYYVDYPTDGNGVPIEINTASVGINTGSVATNTPSVAINTVSVPSGTGNINVIATGPSGTVTASANGGNNDIGGTITGNVILGGKTTTSAPGGVTVAGSANGTGGVKGHFGINFGGFGVNVNGTSVSYKYPHLNLSSFVNKLVKALLNIFTPFRVARNLTLSMGSNVAHVGMGSVGKIRNLTQGIGNQIGHNGVSFLSNLAKIGKSFSNVGKFAGNSVLNATKNGVHMAFNNPIRNAIKAAANMSVLKVGRNYTLNVMKLTPLKKMFQNGVKLLAYPGKLIYGGITGVINGQQGAINNGAINVYNSALNLFQNQTLKGVLKVLNTTDNYIVVTNKAIYLVEDLTSNGGNAAKVFLIYATNGTKFTVGKVVNGTLFIGTISNAASGIRNAIYVLKDGQLNVLVPNLIQAGGFSFNNNGNKLYVVDSGSGRVIQYDYNSNDATATNGNVVFDIASHPELQGTVKDVAVLNNGTLAVAVAGVNGQNGYILGINPVNGAIVGKQAVPFSNVGLIFTNSDGSVSVYNNDNTNGSASGSGSGSASGSASGSGSGNSGLNGGFSYGGSNFTFNSGK